MKCIWEVHQFILILIIISILLIQKVFNSYDPRCVLICAHMEKHDVRWDVVPACSCLSCKLGIRLYLQSLLTWGCWGGEVRVAKSTQLCGSCSNVASLRVSVGRQNWQCERAVAALLQLYPKQCAYTKWLLQLAVATTIATGTCLWLSHRCWCFIPQISIIIHLDYISVKLYRPCHDMTVWLY